MGRTLALDRRSRSVVSRMEHVHLAVADLDRSIDWYEKVFGFSVRWGNGTTAHVGTDRFYVAITEHDGIAPAGVGRADTAHIAHFAFTARDLDEFADRLRDAGVAPSQDASRAEGNALYLRDPDGNAIEVVGYREDYVYA